MMIWCCKNILSLRFTKCHFAERMDCPISKCSFTFEFFFFTSGSYSINKYVYNLRFKKVQVYFIRTVNTIYSMSWVNKKKKYVLSKIAFYIDL